jgi:HTH-type transcriptional regulator/antitoxin HigA
MPPEEKQMDIRPVRTEADHREALAEIERLWNAAPGSAEADKLDILVTLVEKFEEDHYPIVAPDPVEAIVAHIDLTGRERSELGDLLGSRSRASEILNRKRALTVEMIHKLNVVWGIPAEILVQPYHVK